MNSNFFSFSVYDRNLPFKKENNIVISLYPSLSLTDNKHSILQIIILCFDLLNKLAVQRKVVFFEDLWTPKKNKAYLISYIYIY